MKYFEENPKNKPIHPDDFIFAQTISSPTNLMLAYYAPEKTELSRVLPVS